MGVDFVFNDLTDADVEKFAKEAYVFNRDKESIEKDKIILNSFSDEDLGDSVEKLDIAVKVGDKRWNLLKVNDKIEGYNEIPVGYLLSDTEYDKVLIIIRRMSNFLYDKSSTSSNSFIYSVVRDEYKDIVNHSDISGLLASKKIYLDKDFKELSEDIKQRFDEVNANIIIGEISKLIGA